jgi:uncharacterized protein involved in copper resistance
MSNRTALLLAGSLTWSMAAAQHADHAMLEDPLNKLVLLDRFERDADGGDVLRWDLDTWIGHDRQGGFARRASSSRVIRARRSSCFGASFARWWDFVAVPAATSHRRRPNRAAAGVRGLRRTASSSRPRPTSAKAAPPRCGSTRSTKY